MRDTTPQKIGIIPRKTGGDLQKPEDLERHVSLDVFKGAIGLVGGFVGIIATIVGFSSLSSAIGPTLYFSLAALSFIVVLYAALLKERKSRRNEWDIFERKQLSKNQTIQELEAKISIGSSDLRSNQRRFSLDVKLEIDDCRKQMINVCIRAIAKPDDNELTNAVTGLRPLWDSLRSKTNTFGLLEMPKSSSAYQDWVSASWFYLCAVESSVAVLLPTYHKDDYFTNEVRERESEEQSAYSNLVTILEEELS